MPRKAAPLFFAAIALAILACIGWIKWSERGSDARLRADLERNLRTEITGHFADCDLSGLTVRNLKFNQNPEIASGYGSYLFISAEVVVPRRRFATQGVNATEKHYFEPTGAAVYHMVGHVKPGLEKVAILPFLGAIHPVWSQAVPVVMERPTFNVEMQELAAGGANKLFDSHFDTQIFPDGVPANDYLAWFRFLARPELRRTGRLDEAAALWDLDWKDENHIPLQARQDKLKEATALLHALEQAGPGHEKAIAQMRAILK